MTTIAQSTTSDICSTFVSYLGFYFSPFLHIFVSVLFNVTASIDSGQSNLTAMPHSLGHTRNSIFVKVKISDSDRTYQRPTGAVNGFDHMIP